MRSAGVLPGHEIEVKLPADDLEEVRRRLRGSGGQPVAPLHFESNDLYDDDAGTLARRGCALRLRRTDAGSRVTFKGAARFESGVKSREERETAVSDADEAARILEGLGYRRRFRYEKRREDWTLGGCSVALDETPIGHFVEVEGDPSSIRQVLQLLGLDFSTALPYTYAELYRRQRGENPSLPEEMTFEGRSS